jgi:hypothetical protein
VLNHSRPGAVWLALLGSAVGMLLLTAVGLWVYGVYSMSDPGPPVSGARMERGVILVKVPVCPADKPQRLEVQDYDAAASSNSPKVIWRASGPTDAAAKRGEVELFSGRGFRRSAPIPAPSDIPPNIEVDYEGPEWHGGDVFNVKEITKAKLKPGQYWTSKGPKTAAQIDAQLQCDSGTSTPTPTPKPKTDGKEPTG